MRTPDNLYYLDLQYESPANQPQRGQYIVLDDDAKTQYPNPQRKTLCPNPQKETLSTLIDTIIPQDLDTLEPGKWLNSHVVDFYILYMIEKKLDIANRACYFNAVFYNRLKDGQIINYEAVWRYTQHDYLFKYDYLVVPIIEENHWYVAIIWDLPALETVQDGNK
jgi:Ulp1 family protease